MRNASHRALAALALTACLLGGCAATVGTVVGPVSGPVTFWRHTYGVPPWVKVILTPLVIPIGPALGFFEGAKADVEAVSNGGYGVDGGAPFSIVFDPASTRRGSPQTWLDDSVDQKN